MGAQEVISEILQTAVKVSSESKQIVGIFENAGIQVGADMTVTGVKGDAEAALKNLMSALSAMAVVKISAKQIVRKSGISI